MAAYEYETHEYDVVVVGAGGAGLRATLGMAEQGLRTACVTKVFPTRSHTVAAQGGIAASAWQTWALITGNGTCMTRSRDLTGWAIPMRWSIWPARRQRRSMSWNITACRFRAPKQGKIYQRPFGGHTTEFGEGPPVQRTCAAADRTGHAILHTLYGQSLKNNAEFLH